MLTAANQTTVRRIGTRMEVHARMAPAGRTPYVLGRDDLLLLVGRDAARLSCRRRVHAIPPSLIAFLGIGDVAVLELPGPAEVRAFYMTPGLLAEAARLPIWQRDDRQTDRRLVWAITGAALCESADSVNSADDVGSLVEDTAAHASRRVRLTSREPVSHPVVWRARDHLRQEYARRVTLDELAAVVGMRRFALAHAFTREVGMPPHAYQTHVRVHRARELIGRGQVLSSVSQEVGFADQSHLTRHFKRVLGLTPGRYVRAVSAAEAKTMVGRASSA
jgi:AraC-like DNA-binding protein